MINTPNALRKHIGIFGKTNAGKSTLINLITDQNTSIVSEIKGTTTDAVTKAMEIHGLGPIVFIDTPGFDDNSILGEKRVEATKKAILKSDVGIFIFSGDLKSDLEFIKYLEKYKIKIIYAYASKKEHDKAYLEKIGKYNPLKIDLKDPLIYKKVIARIKGELEEKEEESITSNLVKEGDLIMLVMPQDIQAPKGRLILPQVSTIRELLDKKCAVMSSTMDQFDLAISSLAKKPDLIITDSQCFKQVYDKKPKESMLTSFSVLFSAYKGDIKYFVESVKILEMLKSDARILIAEACTHPPLEEDIGRVKIPRMLKKRYGDGIKIDFVRGIDFNPQSYDLIIHCGACMFNRKHVLSRVQIAKEFDVPMTNYGVVIAYLQGILDKVVYPQ